MTTSHAPFTIAYYITPHGFGHAVRSLEVIRLLLELEPRLDVVLVSDLPEFLIIQNVGKPLRQIRKRLDVGLVQTDSLRFDLEATLAAVRGLNRMREELVDEEVRFLKAYRVGAIVADVPFLAFPAASRCNIPGIGLGNFTWDWIYRGYGQTDERWGPLVSWIQECYGLCDLFLQLPMHGDCSACPTIQDVPLVARMAAREPQETRRLLSCGARQKAFLVSFVSLDLGPDAQRRVELMNDVVFFYRHPLRLSSNNARTLDDFAQLSYADAVAAMDGVITKPGYGIVSDCLAVGTPIVYTDRGCFPEYDILVEAIEDHLTAVYMPSQDLYSGEWESAIKRINGLPKRTPRVRTDGAQFCARAILERINHGRS